MAHPVSGINPTILAWARSRSGQTIDQVAEAIGKDAEIVRQWESGASAPTYVQLETLAYKVYKRPLALFFFPEPPDEPEPKQAFRTLPDFEIDELSSDTRFKIRQALALQLSLGELAGGKKPGDRVIVRDLAVHRSRGTSQAAKSVRNYLKLPLDLQKSWKSTEEALKGWRTSLEEAGVFVFKDTFKQKDVSGFSLFDAEFPLIYVNNSTSKPRQIFTLLHELAHLLTETSGVTKRDDTYIASLHGHARDVEVFCNALTAQILLPDEDFKKQNLTASDQNVLRLSRLYKVSREAVLRRFLEFGLVTQKLYQEKAKQWAQDYFSSVQEEGGGNYYLTHAAYLSDTYMRLAFGSYYRGKITLDELASYLNVKASNVEGLEQVFVERTR